MLVAEFPSQEIQENFCQDPGLKAALSRVAVEKLEEATAQQVHQLGASWDPIFVGVLGSNQLISFYRWLKSIVDLNLKVQ